MVAKSAYCHTIILFHSKNMASLGLQSCDLVASCLFCLFQPKKSSRTHPNRDATKTMCWSNDPQSPRRRKLAFVPAEYSPQKSFHIEEDGIIMKCPMKRYKYVVRLQRALEEADMTYIYAYEANDYVQKERIRLKINYIEEMLAAYDANNWY